MVQLSEFAAIRQYVNCQNKRFKINLWIGVNHIAKICLECKKTELNFITTSKFVSHSRVLKTKINRQKNICMTVMNIVLQLSFDELSISRRKKNTPKIEKWWSHGVPFLSSNVHKAEHMPIGFCCNLSPVVYVGQATGNLRKLYLIRKVFVRGWRIPSSSGPQTNDLEDKIVH